MSSHRKPRRRLYRRPVALTSLLSVGMAAAIVGFTTLSGEATAFGHHPSAAAPASPTPSVTASPSPSSSPSSSPSPSPSASPSTAPEANANAGGSTAEDTSEVLAPAELGTTATAPVNSESDRVGVLYTGSTAAGNHSCSASVLHSSTKNLILTAAHCVAGTDSLSFAPGYRDGSTPYGSWQITKTYTTNGWTQNTDQDQDFAILQVAPNDGRDIEDVVGGNALGLNASFSDVVRLYGYPSDTELPILCANATSRQDTYQRRIDCPSYPSGTSGGPWIDTATNQVIGVIGGYQQGGDTDDISYSAYFDNTIGSLFQQAVTGSA